MRKSSRKDTPHPCRNGEESSVVRKQLRAKAIAPTVCFPLGLTRMVKPKVYADFHNADAKGRLRLNCVGTIEDLARQGITLRDGMPLTLYSDDLDPQGQLDEIQVEGVVSFSAEEHCWVAAIDWSA